jgi:WD40 repeat protein
MGIWSGNMDGTDVNSVDRSPNGKYLATADDFGKVNLFHFPALNSKGSPHGSFVGHSSHVTCVRWARSECNSSSNAKDYLLSIGGEDKCVFLWKLEEALGGKTKDHVHIKRSSFSLEENENEAVLEIGGGDEFMAVKPWLGAIVAPTAWVHPDTSSFSLYFSKLSDYIAAFKQLIEFRESLTIPYYVSDRVVNASNMICISTPSNLQDCYNRLNHLGETVLTKLYEVGVADCSPPNHDELELDFVYGYRGYDCRNNIFSLRFRTKTDRYILYFAAALGILFNISMHKQSYFRGHSDDIMCMAINCQYELLESYVVATGQQGKGNVYLWEIPSMQTLHVISTKQKTVNAVAFSRADNGKILLTLSEDKILVAIDWKSQSILVTQQMEGNIIYGLSAVSDGSSNMFITSGDKIIRLWSIQGRNVSSTKFVTSTCQKAKLQSFSCVVECCGYGFVGADDGNIYLVPIHGKGVKAVFSQQEYFKTTCSSSNKASGKSKLNEASITALQIFDQEFLFSGAKDGSIVIWTMVDLRKSETIQPLFGYFIQDMFPQNPNYIFAKQVQSISIDSVESHSCIRMIIGTRGCDIIETVVDIERKTACLYEPSHTSVQSNGVIMRGHCNEEVWGLATHPFKPEFCTTGLDIT